MAKDNSKSSSIFTPGADKPYQDYRSPQSCPYMEGTDYSWLAKSVTRNEAIAEQVDAIYNDPSMRERNMARFSGETIFDATKKDTY